MTPESFHCRFSTFHARVFEFSRVFGQNGVLSHFGAMRGYFSARAKVFRVSRRYSGLAKVFRFSPKVFRFGQAIWTLRPQHLAVSVENTNTANGDFTFCLKTKQFVPRNALVGLWTVHTPNRTSVLQSSAT